ncbi:PAS domain-containing sensor histidine kinase, partial [Bacillus atrophaeus]|nr:PAS domain-containing sensor histidine kinase [Bacillus atrophaeus]
MSKFERILADILKFLHQNQNLYVFLPPYIHDICKERLKRVLEKQEILELIEAKLIRSDGETIDVEVMIAP